MEKARNFKVFIESKTPDDELKQQMELFKEAMLIPTLMSLVVPAFNSGQVPGLAATLCSHLQQADHTTREKVERYLTCFAEVLLQ